MERAIAGFRRSGDRSDQVPARSRKLQGEPAVSQGELEQVVEEYRRVHEEHRRAPARSRTRRHLELRLQELRARFERLLAEAPVSTADRRHWRNRLRGKEALARAPGDVRPLLFRGRSDSGSEIRLRGTVEGTVEALVDGAAVAVLDRADELLGTTPESIFVLNGMQFRETFGASPSCLADLRDAEESSRRPRPRYVKALIEDGLVDRTLGLTARGRRALALDRVPARHAEVEIAPAISIRGSIPSRARENLARALVRVAGVAPEPVLHITASLDRHEDPALDRPFAAKATLDVNGRAVRAHVAAASVSEAIHLLEGRLHRNLRALAEHDLAERREERLPEAGERRRVDLASLRPSYLDRPVTGRKLVRRTFEPEHRFVEHGGEVEVELHACDEIGILAAGLDAFAELVAGNADGEPMEVGIGLQGRDRALLLVDWLNELLYLAEVERFVPTRIEAIELDDAHLQATVAGYCGMPRPLVKGIALNRLAFEQEGGAWHGRVVFDV